MELSALRTWPSIYLAPHAPWIHIRAPCPSGVPAALTVASGRPLLPGAGTSPPPQLVSPLCLVHTRLPGAEGPCRDQTRARSLMALGTSGRNQNKHWFCTIKKKKNSSYIFLQSLAVSVQFNSVAQLCLTL